MNDKYSIVRDSIPNSNVETQTDSHFSTSSTIPRVAPWETLHH